MPDDLLKRTFLPPNQWIYTIVYTQMFVVSY